MALFMLSLCSFDISDGVGAFAIGLGQISSFLSCNDHVIKSSSQVKHLGVIIDNNLSGEYIVDSIETKSIIGYNRLRFLYRQKKFLVVKCKLSLLSTYIMSSWLCLQFMVCWPHERITANITIMPKRSREVYIRFATYVFCKLLCFIILKFVECWRQGHV